MSIAQYDPFSQLDTLARQVFGGGTTSSRTPRFMPLDLYKEGNSYVINADLPGVDPDSIDIDIDNGVLTIAAERTTGPERKEHTDESGTTWVTNERFTGSYRRQVTVGDSIDNEHVSADYSGGVLTVTLPLAERAKSRKISVTHSDSSAAGTIEAEPDSSADATTSTKSAEPTGSTEESES
ncbi:Hsp20/alpha crystallin family protein [Corynebacterium atypicum]|uniref:Hsp20/alpha crystallin family protein n=1 Tax=Corynebacterium atypicum TaxID=191610 RepID=UPI000B24ACA9|nr:Hsp20/alpha crystallin family protein [Corynebacterium atypicum]